MAITQLVDSTGSLLIKDTNATFGRSTVGNVLVCSNEALNTSLSVVIFVNTTSASDNMTRSYEGLQNLSKRAGPMYSFETSEKGLLNYNSNCMFTYYGI